MVYVYFNLTKIIIIILNTTVVIAHSKAAEDGIHITFKHPINEDKQKEILKALNADNNVNFCKFTDNKVLFINITPAP